MHLQARFFGLVERCNYNTWVKCIMEEASPEVIMLDINFEATSGERQGLQGLGDLQMHACRGLCET